MKQITAIINGKPTLAVCGISVSELTNGEKPCGGHGKCGGCKIIARGCLSAPTAEELKLSGSPIIYLIKSTSWMCKSCAIEPLFSAT